MEKPTVEDASTYAAACKETGITRSITKSDTELQGLLVDRNNQVILKKSKTPPMRFLPEEIMFKIFLFLPAQVLHDVMRLVCRTWLKVITDPVFTNAHFFSRSPSKSLLKVIDFDDHIEVFSINKDEITWNPIRRFNQEYLTHGDGLILSVDRDDHSILYLLNPITNQVLTLPQAPTSFNRRSQRCAVAYSPSTLKYKVVCTLNSSTAYILTVGVDEKWRNIFITPDVKELLLSGFIHWDPRGVWGMVYWYYWCSRNSIIVLDLEDEIFYKVNFLEENEGIEKLPISIKADRIPSIVTHQDYKCWHFWELTDHKNGGEWRKLGILDFENVWMRFSEITGLEIDRKLQNRLSVLGLNGDEAIFRYDRFTLFFAYNFKTGLVSRSFESDYTPKVMNLMLTSSLVVLSTDKSMKNSASCSTEKLQLQM